MVVDLAPEAVAGADLQPLNLAQDVDLHQGHAGRPVQTGRVAGHRTVEPAYPACPAGHRAVLPPPLSDQLAELVQQLGREGSVADPAGVALDHDHGLVDAGGRDAASGQRAARGGVGAGDVGVGPEIEVEHRRLGALEQDVPATVEGGLDDREGVLDVRVEAFGVFEILGQQGLGVERLLCVELLQDRVLHLADHEVELLAHEDLLLEVADPEPDPPNLVAVGRADAAPGGTQAIVAPDAFLELVEERVVAHHHVRALADDQVVGLEAALPELVDLLQQDARVDHHPVADDAGAGRVEDAAGQELELELAVLGDDGVARVVATLAPDGEVGPLGEEVDYLALALIAPLASDDDHDHAASLDV